MSLEEAERILVASPPDPLGHAITRVFRPLLANILLDNENPKFHVVRKNNKLIKSVLQRLPESVVQTLFDAIDFKLECRNDSEMIYTFGGDVQKLSMSDNFFSYIEEKLRERRLGTSRFQPPLASRVELDWKERKDALIQEIRRDIDERRRDINESRLAKAQDALCHDDFTSVESLKEKSRLTLLNRGRLRNSLFGCQHFSLRRMTHGRAYVCKEGCPADFLEAHWHLFTGRNMLYSHIAHLTPDGSTAVHVGVEHGYQYNSIPGTVNFRETIHFSAKRVNEESGALDLLEHPNQPRTACVYCGVPFSKLFI
uniref:Uncharacterized protein TCIL3000_11_13510 n=1 Tax=Trypanosoma congolense (strain IL3000) TaxID=1068625 RepID=G0V2H3_TRYCI|nr:unnamed protein product [Trypanosoma congolense IL3000]